MKTPASAPARPSLVGELRLCEDLLLGRGLINFLLCQIWSKVVWVVPVFVTLSLVRTIRAPSLVDFLDCLCGLLAQYSGGTATLFLAFRRQHMASFIGHVRLLAERLDRENGPPHEQVTAGPAWWMRRVRTIAASWVQTGAVLVLMQVILSKPPVPTIPDLSNGPFWLITSVLEFVKWVFCGGCFITLWMLVVVSATSLLALHRSVTERASLEVGYRGVLAMLRQHQQVCLLEDELGQLLYHFLLHYMFAVGVVPLVNTIQMLQGSANLLSLMTFSTLPVTIGAFSLLGDHLIAASERLALVVYSAPWINEGSATRRLRQLVIARALRAIEPHHGTLSVVGFGSFSLVSALAYIRTWYSYFQLLLKASTSWS